MLPPHESLERLVCAAIIAAYPERGPYMQQWLVWRPGGPAAAAGLGGEEFACSHMAGWFADHGCDDFDREIWRDGKIPTHLQSRLTAIVAWTIAQQIAA
jgi:hypothetical protein